MTNWKTLAALTRKGKGRNKAWCLSLDEIKAQRAPVAWDMASHFYSSKQSGWRKEESGSELTRHQKGLRVTFWNETWKVVEYMFLHTQFQSSDPWYLHLRSLSKQGWGKTPNSGQSKTTRPGGPIDSIWGHFISQHFQPRMFVFKLSGTHMDSKK